MTTSIVHIENIGEVTFHRNSRSRRIKISVKPDKSVFVSYPYRVSVKEASQFLKKSETWILRQRQKFNEKSTIFTEDSLIKTKLYTIHFLRGDNKNIEINGNAVYLTLTDFDSDQSRTIIENVLVKVYRTEAKQILPGRLKELAVKHGFRYNNVTVRNNRSNWGSCSSKNNISLNLHMMKLPYHLIDYILLHELVHTEIKNHSQRFWDRLNQITGFNARQMAKQVKQYSTYIF